MSSPDNNKVLIVFWLAVLAWAIAFTASFVSFQITDPTGDSFTRGLNRVGAFLGWQLLAGVIGIIVWINFRQRNLGSAARWAARIPPIIFALLVIAMLALFILGKYLHTSPDSEVVPPRPVTQT